MSKRNRHNKKRKKSERDVDMERKVNKEYKRLKQRLKEDDYG